MAALQHFPEMHPNKGLLPPLRELFLEIQVNKLINDYLFSSSAEEACPLSDESAKRSVDVKEATASLVATSTSACNVASLQSSRLLNDHHRCSPHGAHPVQSLATDLNRGEILDSHVLRSCDTCIKVGEHFPWCSPKAVCDASLVDASAIQKEGGGATCLSRVDTFPCTSKEGLQRSVPLRPEMEMKISAKKPPLPPKLVNSLSNKHDPSFKRCFSDVGASSQSSRRGKLERKKKSMSSSGGNAALWALLCTFCFAVIMIGQGFGSQENNGLQAYSTGAPSSTNEYLSPSTLGGLEDASSDNMPLASGKGVLSHIDRAKTEVPAEQVSDMKQGLNLGT